MKLGLTARQLSSCFKSLPTSPPSDFKENFHRYPLNPSLTVVTPVSNSFLIGFGFIKTVIFKKQVSLLNWSDNAFRYPIFVGKF